MGAQLEFAVGWAEAAARAGGVALAAKGVAEFLALAFETALAVVVGGRAAVLGVGERGKSESQRESGKDGKVKRVEAHRVSVERTGCGPTGMALREGGERRL